MRPSVALSIGGIFYVLFGLITLLAPAQLLTAAGWPPPSDETLVPARDSATVLIVLGVIDWLARDAVGSPLRGLLWGNLLRPVASVVVNVWEIATGAIPASVVGVAAVALGVDLALFVLFALALRNADAAQAVPTVTPN
jgi:hypothetical protein